MRRIILSLALCPVLWSANQARAELAVSAEPLVIAVEREPVNNEISVYRAYVTVGGNKFTFIIPERFRTEGDPEHGRLQLKTVEGNTVINFNFLATADANSPAPGPDAYRESLAGRYPNGKFVQEFSRPAVGATASVFDIEWKGAGELMQKTRALYVTTPAGVLSLTLTTGLKNFPVELNSLDELLGTLSASVNGKLTVHRLSDRI